MLIADFGNLRGPITAEWCGKLIAAGVGGAMIGLQYPGDGSGIAHQQIECVLESPLQLVACYAESEDVDQIWHHVAPFAGDIPQIFKAVEEDVITVDRSDIDRNLNFIDGLNLKRRGGIYTRKGFWEGLELAEPGQPSIGFHWYGDRDLAAAQYDDIPDVDVFDPIADWQRCQIKQFRANVNIGGGLVDLNVTRGWA